MNSAAVETAWQEYVDDLNAIRRDIFRHPFAEEDRPGAHYLFLQAQAIAFNRVIAPNPAYPRFYLHGQFEPMTYTMGGPCADIQYRQAFVNGAWEYRIWGKRGTAHKATLQVMAGYWGNSGPSLIESVDLDEFCTVDGSFEIVASPKEQSSNWIRLDPNKSRCCIFFREIFLDWHRERPSAIHIARSRSEGRHAVLPSEDELVERLGLAINFIREFVGSYSHSMVEGVANSAGYNIPLKDEKAWPGANAAAGYHFISYELDDGEALLLTLDWGHLPYWSLQATDVWHQTLEPIHHQSSINSFQAVPDDDGLYRLVVAHDDPGVSNWIDVLGHRRGFLELRAVPAQPADIPVAEVVGLKDVLRILPSSVRLLDSADRAEALDRRRDAALELWGY